MQIGKDKWTIRVEIPICQNCCPLTFLSGDSPFQNTHRNTHELLFCIVTVWRVLSGNAVQVRYGQEIFNHAISKYL